MNVFFFELNNCCVFTFRQKMSALPCHKLSSIKSKAMKYNIIGIDEGQFVSFDFLAADCYNQL